jgi:hypothetical protein
MTFLISILFFFNIGQANLISNFTNKESFFQDSTYLKTGWYFVTTKESGIQRKIQGMDEVIFIDPAPIVTVYNFKELEIYKSNNNDFGLLIKLDTEGSKSWGIATKKTIGNRIALIIDNELIFTPQVNAQITTGISALNRGDLSEEELKNLKLKIEKEINNLPKPGHNKR